MAETTSELERYSRRHRHVRTTALPPLLSVAFEPGVIVDLGAGDGAILWALERRGALRDTAHAVDLSPERIAVAETVSPRVRGIVADACDVPAIPSASTDGVIASQVIEHLPDDRRLAAEIVRLLRPGGWFYVGSIVRSPRAFWFYRVDGERRLDPTHVREYRSAEELVAVLKHPELDVRAVSVAPLAFPVTDLALRSLARLGVASTDLVSGVYEERPHLERLRRLVRLRVPGYSLVEVIGNKRHATRPEEPQP